MTNHPSWIFFIHMFKGKVFLNIVHRSSFDLYYAVADLSNVSFIVPLGEYLFLAIVCIENSRQR